MKCLRWMISAALLCGMVACDKKEEEEKTENTYGHTIGSSASEGGVAEVATHITTMKEGMLPGSLVLDTGSLRLTSQGPCAETDGFFDCQPVLIKLYLSISRMIIGATAEFVGHTSELVNKLPVGSSGTLPVPSSSESADTFSAVEYNVTSAANYQLRFLDKDSKPLIYLDVDSSAATKKYKMFFAVGAVADEGEEKTDERMEANFEYVDDTHFTADIVTSGKACDPDDFRAPEKFHINVIRADDVWQGKAMLHHPRFLMDENDSPCDQEATDSSGMFMYTDFVGNDTNTTASLYMMKESVTDMSAANLASWGASAFCSNFSLCMNDHGFGDPNPVSSYTNPFCVTADDATWGGACADFGVDDYSADSLWDVPADFADRQIEDPASVALR